MGWENYHLHAFRVGGVGYAQPDPDDELGYRDERTFRLADLVTTADRIEYEYDFGDSWEHELVVEARTVAADDSVLPGLHRRRGACPPEDCGGSYGFAELKELLAGPPSAEREEMLEWAAVTTTPPASTWRRPTKPSRSFDPQSRRLVRTRCSLRHERRLHRLRPGSGGQTAVTEGE